MARFSMEQGEDSRRPQEIGPLNPYARRIVHLTVAEDPAMSSESIGDAFLKTVDHLEEVIGRLEVSHRESGSADRPIALSISDVLH